MVFSYFDMLSGAPILINNVGHLRSPTLFELSPTYGVGYSRYSLYLNHLSWSKEQLLKYGKFMKFHGIDRLTKMGNLTVFDIATLIKPMRDFFQEIFSFFMLEDCAWNEDHRCYLVYASSEDGDGQVITGTINKENFEDVRKCILQLNFIGLDSSETNITHSSERSAELWARAQQHLQEQAQKTQNEKKPEYDIGNIVSKVCAAHSSYNLLNVYKLTVFQLYDAFFQLGYIRGYDLSERIFSTHGGDKFNFEDWLKPILQNK